MQRINKITLLTALLLAVSLSGCHQWDNFTTYFNTYYNMERILKECEEEFEYQDEKKRIQPRVYVPDTKIKLPEPRQSGLPPFLTEFVIAKRKRQPVKVKLDSMIIKGSKILSKHPKSDYIQGTLFLMATSFFYQNLWLNSQIKCGELIDRFPDGELSPDAHLLLAKNLLIQRKFEAGKVVLSRTVDIAWQLERYDILSEAFRIEAELAMFQNDYEEAVKPYKQAIIQSDNGEMRAKWQFDLAALVFRMGRFELAEKLFAKVHYFDPDYITQFEAFLYQASSLSRLGKYEEAEEILNDLESDGKYEEWVSNVFAERMNIYRLKEMDEDFQKGESYSDTTYVGNPALAAVYYEKGLDYFSGQDYSNARLYFGKARSVANPVSKKAGQIYNLLDQWNRIRASIIPKMKKIDEKRSLTKTEQGELALNMYEMGRVQEQLGNIDSAEYYYLSSTTITIPENIESARFYYSYARFLEEKAPLQSDSLLEIIVERYPLTEYGQDALIRLGYTEQFVIDTVTELYNSGIHLWKNKEYDFAIVQLSKLFNYYPQSPLAPKAIYTIGWILEKDIELYDQALEYYKLLIVLYPQSEYAGDMRRTADYASLIQDSLDIPDSLKSPHRTLYHPKIHHLYALPDPEKIERKSKMGRPKSIEATDILSDPTSIFDGLLESIPSPGDLLDEGKDMLDKVSSTDSLKNFLPGVNITDPLKGLEKSKKKSGENEDDDEEEENKEEGNKEEKDIIPPKEEKEKK
ncbi:tetratricopeptide repeat protein [Bacteroidota bacterium]